MPSMLTSLALEVCQLSVVDWPGLSVFGFAESEAVGAFGAGGGGGGGGATFLWHAPRNIKALRANISVAHLLMLIGDLTPSIVACFTDSSSFPCAHSVACDLQLDGRAHFQPAASPFLNTRSVTSIFIFSALRRSHLVTPAVRLKARLFQTWMSLPKPGYSKIVSAP